MDESLEDIIQNDEPTVEGKLRDMAIDDDAAFEFMEQFDTCKEWMTAGYTINFVKSHQDIVDTDNDLALQVHRLIESEHHIMWSIVHTSMSVRQLSWYMF